MTADDTATADRMAQLTDLRAVNQQLQATIDALRGQMELARHDADDRVARAQAAMADEIGQLKAAVQAMRDRTDAQATESETAIQIGARRGQRGDAAVDGDGQPASWRTGSAEGERRTGIGRQAGRA